MNRNYYRGKITNQTTRKPKKQNKKDKGKGVTNNKKTLKLEIKMMSRE
jgi:hypothetical protein